MNQQQSPDTWLGLSHLLSLFLGIIGSIIALAIAKSDAETVHARHALNWQLSVLIYVLGLLIILSGLSVVMFMNLGAIVSLDSASGVSVSGGNIAVFFVMLIALLACLISIITLFIIDLVNCIRAMIKANVGESWRYPFSIRFITITDELV